ncbi:MAG TPA: uracil-DNA glycosylase [Firmicutes bacterium]|jgi:uracil-DNA glycosylase|nr:uracil-DNA glycosylase [Bacillota bacterium]
MAVVLENDWDELLAPEFEKDYYKMLRRFLIQEYRTTTVYPDMYHIFEALKRTSFAETRVVLLGQDPYHGKGQAHGLAFSVQRGVPKPPSLQNIFKELSRDLALEIPGHGCLESWADQGILLLNTTLTVRDGQAGSHRGRGWETFTDTVLARLNEKETPLVFLLWGRHAQSKEPLIINKRHLVLKTVHPSPLSAHRGFFGCSHFSKVNEFFRELGQEPVNWQVQP